MIKPTMTNQQLTEFIQHAMKVTEADLEFIQRGQIHGT